MDIGGIVMKERAKKTFSRIKYYFIALVLAVVLESLLQLNYSIFYDEFNLGLLVTKFMIYIITFIVVDIVRNLLNK